MIEVLHLEEFSNGIGKVRRIYLKIDKKEYCISEVPDFINGGGDVQVFESENCKITSHSPVLSSRESTAENCLRNLVSGEEEVYKK